MHLKGFGLENFRVFKDYTWFDFAPITILVGPNNSGKSSLIKALLLLKDAKIDLSQENYNNKFSKGTKFPKLNFENPALNLMGLETVINNKKKTIIPFYLSFDDRFFKEKLVLCIEFSDKKHSFFYQLQFKNGEILYRLGTDNNIYFHITLFFKMLINNEIVEIVEIEQESNQELRKRIEALNYFTNFDRTLNDSFMKNIKQNPDFFSKQDYLFPDIVESWNDTNFDDFPTEAGIMMDIQDACSKKEGLVRFEKFLEYNSLPIEFATHFYNLLDLASINNTVLNIKRNITYLPSIKGFQRRSFRTNEDDVLNQVIKNIIRTEKKDKFLRKWESIFKLEGKINWQTDSKLGISFLDLNNKSLVDLGFGVSQLVAILLSIYKYSNRTKMDDFNDFFENLGNRNKFKQIMIFEEPEANLHPAFQSNLADLFYESMRDFELQFIIETHSEYMIRKFQYLVAKGELKKEDVVIYYFNDPNNVPKGEKQVKKIEIQEDGSLSDDFGAGFFDEAANWELELLRLKKNKTRQN